MYVNDGDGKPMGFMQRNKCGLVAAYHSTDVMAEQFEKEGKETIMRLKEYFEQQGWQTSWGYDLCPECAKRTADENLRGNSCRNMATFRPVMLAR